VTLLNAIKAFNVTYVFVCARVFCFFLCMPAMGESFLPKRVRVLIAFVVPFMMTPFLMDVEGAALKGTTFSIDNFFKECFCGLFMGSLLRILWSMFGVVGTFASQQSLFSNTLGSGLSSEMKDIFSVFIEVYFLSLFFVCDLHIMVIRGFFKSYEILQVGALHLEWGFLETSLVFLKKGFEAAAAMAIPFLLGGILYAFFLGVLNRLVPMIPAFFIGQPLSIFGTFVLVMVCMHRFATVFTDVWGEVAKEWLS